MTELRHTLRFLATHKSFTAAAVLTLAIGLGANTALFGLVNVVLRPLDIPEPDRLVAIAADTPGDDSGGFQYAFSLEAHSLSGIFGYFIFELGAVQAAGMGILGLALALVGVYGVVSFGASLRTREVGIRMALGAQPADVLRLILGHGVSVVTVGLIVGLAAAWRSESAS